MNYYEQFYDDLEFCEYDDGDSYGNAPGFHNNQCDYDDRQMCLRGPPLGRGFHPPEHREQTLPYGNDHYGMQNEIQDFNNAPYHREHEHKPNSDRVYRHRGRGGFDRIGGSGNQFRGNIYDKMGARGNHDRGNNARSSLRGRFAAVNFVKEGQNNLASQNELQNSDDKNDIAMNPSNHTIRFDYKKFQNQKTETEMEVELALKAYSQQFPVGLGYGYGPRSDLFDGTPQGFVSTDEEPMREIAACNSNGIANDNLANSGQILQATVVSTDNSSQSGQLQSIPTTPIKKAMIKPAFNFVKAQSEFKSTDVAFHETEKQSGFGHVQANTSIGNKRVGLGFSASHTYVPTQSVDSVSQVSSGMKHGCNQEMNTRFARLSEAVKLKNLPGKNGIEILHMAIDKVKMALNDQVQPNGRTATGQPLFVCKLEIDGVAIAQCLATAKKVAKHEAYAKAVKILLSQAVTVQEVSAGVFELKSNNGDIEELKTTDKSKVQQSIVASHSHQQNESENKQPSAVVVKGAAKQQAATVTPSYTIPKMTFHQAVQSKVDKPWSFQKSETQTMMVHNMDAQQQQSTISNAQSAAMKDPAAMAMKLLNVVKDGDSQNCLEISKKNEQTSAMALESERNQDMVSRLSTGTSVHLNATESPFQSTVGKKRPLDTTNIHVGHPKARRTVTRSHNTLDDLSQFIIIDNTPIDSGINDMSILHISANFNKVLLKVEYEMTNVGLRCSMVLSNHTIANVLGETREIAKLNTASKALKYLRDICYTIKVKQHVDTETGALTKEQLLSDIQRGGEMIPDSNIGNMLLRKMGWAGGGVGKVGQGIAEPVKAEMVIGREGLGLKAHKGIGKEFHGKVTKMLQDYLKSDEQSDLHFSSELSREERAIIHATGQRMGLKTVSKGKDDNRYLIVSRKRSAQELLEHVLGSGGCTSKYEVIPPSGMQFDVGMREDICHGQEKQ